MPFRKTRFYAAIELPRPINCLITFASVLLGGWLGIHRITEPLLFAALSAALITAGGNALNDLCGITEDRINKPHRPLPSGRLSPGIARIEMGIFLLAGILLALPLTNASPRHCPHCHRKCLTLYNAYLKRVPLIGNLTVSALGGLAFLYGGAAVQVMSAPWIIAGFAFLFHLGRELLKDLEDSAGDRQLSGGTVPISWGENIARVFNHRHLCNPHYRNPIARAPGHLQLNLSLPDCPTQPFTHLRPHPPLAKRHTRIP